MYNQTPINRLNDLPWSRNTETDKATKATDSQHGIRHLLADISELVELQAKLTATGLRLSLYGMVAPAILLVLAAILSLGTVPIILLAFANALVIEFQWPSYAAQLASGGLAILVTIALVSLAIFKLKRVTIPMEQSVNELSKNFETIRDLLKGQMQSDREVPNHPR